MSLQSYEYGLSPHDGFKVYRQFQFNHNHLEILNRLYMPLIARDRYISLYEPIRE